MLRLKEILCSIIRNSYEKYMPNFENKEGKILFKKFNNNQLLFEIVKRQCSYDNFFGIIYIQIYALIIQNFHFHIFHAISFQYLHCIFVRYVLTNITKRKIHCCSQIISNLI
jgi:hypothetical protein